MRRIGLLLLLLSMPFLFVGCIEINEDIIVNADGSGTLKMSIDMGLIGASVNNDNTMIDVNFIEKIRKMPAQASETLKNIKGVKNIVVAADDKKGYYSVCFDFQNSKVLNKAIYMVFGQKKKAIYPSFVKISKHKLKKTDLSPFIQRAFKEMKQNTYNEMLYAFITMNSTYHLPSNVKKAKNIKSQQPDSLTVTTKFTLDELLRGGFDFGNVITY